MFLRLKCDRQKFFVIVGHFLHFHPTNNLKNKDFDKMKKPPWSIIILHKCTKNHDHVLHCFWDMAAHDGCNFYFSFWAIFCTSTPLTAWKSKLKEKIEKTPGDIIILHNICTKNYDHLIQGSWELVCDRQT